MVSISFDSYLLYKKFYFVEAFVVDGYIYFYTLLLGYNYRLWNVFNIQATSTTSRMPTMISGLLDCQAK